MSRSAIIKAIYSTASGCSDFNDAVGGRIFFNEAPANQPMPYAVFWLPAGSFKEVFGGVQMASDDLQWNLYFDDASPSSILTAWGYLKAAFDKQTISLETGDHIGTLVTSVVGPERLEDAWQLTARLVITYV